ncbi:hypothetical protein [Salipaludibacillus daqingensis]|uniref:hypothetical protein n=1 Tax=Salipaludibacillus daqingensis TaxID=3041001 RepID=UPI002474A9F7|nr:hypothetical protein [Salipaludibacillus daqingensis]
MRLFLLCIGFIMATVGGISLVAYLNLLTVGYSLQEYSLFIVQRVETYMFIVGMILIWVIVYPSMNRNQRKKNIKK